MLTHEVIYAQKICYNIFIYEHISCSLEWFDALFEASSFSNTTNAESRGAVRASASAAGFLAQEESAGRIVLTGTIGTYDYDTVVSLQGVPDYSIGAERGSMYRLIVPDEPQTMTLTGPAVHLYRLDSPEPVMFI